MADVTSTQSATSFKRYAGGFNKRLVVTADTNNLASNKGFMVNLDGILSCRLRAESALIPTEVLAGVIYPGDVAQVDITGSTTVTKVYLLQQG